MTISAAASPGFARHAVLETDAPRSADTAVSRVRDVLVEWRSPMRNVWVGHRSDRSFAGIVRREGARYLASDAAGLELGEFPSLVEAESAVGEFAIDDDRPSRIPMILAAVAGSVAVATAVAGLVVLSL